MSLNANRNSDDFDFKNSGQVDDLGPATGDYTVVQGFFDSRALNNLTDLNNVKTTMRSVVDGDSGSDNIARYNGDGYGPTIEAAVRLLISAGSGTIPPDDTISTAKIVDDAVTNDKLGTDVKVGSNATLNIYDNSSVTAYLVEMQANTQWLGGQW